MPLSFPFLCNCSQATVLQVFIYIIITDEYPRVAAYSFAALTSSSRVLKVLSGGDVMASQEYVVFITEYSPQHKNSGYQLRLLTDESRRQSHFTGQCLN